MQTSYKLDLSPESHAVAVTPNPQALALAFQPVSCGLFDCGPEYFTARSGLDNYLLIYTLSGCGEVDVGKGRHSAGPGQAVVIHCINRHFYATAPGGRWRFLYCHFRGAMEAYGSILANGPLALGNRAEEFRTLFERLLAAASEGGPACFLISNDLLTRMLTILALACLSANADGHLQRHLPALAALCAFLRENYARPIALDEMAARMHMSKYHFARLFRAYAQMSPHAYLTDLRVNAARELLHLGNASVREIGEHVGFGDCNTFIRLFKKRCGITPARYRALWRGQSL